MLRQVGAGSGGVALRAALLPGTVDAGPLLVAAVVVVGASLRHLRGEAEERQQRQRQGPPAQPHAALAAWQRQKSATEGGKRAGLTSKPGACYALCSNSSSVIKAVENNG